MRPANSKVPLRSTPSFFKEAIKRNSLHCLWFVLPNNGSLKFSVIIPKKVAAKATARNKLKRLVYDCAEKVFSQHANLTFWLVVKLKKTPSSFFELEEEVTTELQAIIERNV